MRKQGKVTHHKQLPRNSFTLHSSNICSAGQKERVLKDASCRQSLETKPGVPRKMSLHWRPFIYSIPTEQISFVAIVISLYSFSVDGTYWDSVYHYQPRPRPDPASIIQANNEIVVQRGCSVMVDPLNHLATRVQAGDRCYFTVLDHEPLAQRYGTLTPKKFPCSFRKGDVEYLHFGSQSGGTDCVRLQLRYDTPTDTIVLPLTLRLLVIPNAQKLVTLIQPLVVDKRNGNSNPINSQGLGIAIGEGASKCMLTPLIGTGGYPRYGSLLNYFPSSQPVDCNAFLNLGVRYKLNSITGSPTVDFVPFMVEKLDKQDRKLQQEHFQIKVILDGAAVNNPPKPSFLSLMMMEVNQFVMTAITNDMLAAEDQDSDPDALIFNVVTPPEQGTIISTDNPDQPVSSFYQKDLRDLKIAFKPPAEDFDFERILHAEFEVVDQEGSTSERFSFMIVVKPMNTLAPVVTLNAGQLLFEGQSRPLSSSLNLRISDEDNLVDVRISVVHGLRYGKLTVLGSQRKFFTPDDLDAGVVVYEHDGSETCSDNIVFRMTDGKNVVEFLFPVTIVPQDNEPPVVNVNTGLVVLKGEVKQILPGVLSATDVDSENRHLKFTLVPPYSLLGQVLLRQTKTPVDISSWRFSETDRVFERVTVEWYLSDIQEGKLFYSHVGPSWTSTITDQFTFRVQDDNEPPNQSGDQIFYIKVNPIDDLAPELFPGTTLKVTVREYETTVLSKNMLHFTDRVSADRDLRYTIILPSINQDLNNTTLLGHFVLTDSPDTIIPEFTQAQINYGKVSYKPPNQEIGLIPREIQCTFTVKDAAGNLANGHFTIVIEPVNNKPPQITNIGFNVVSKSNYVITKDVLDVTDQDTVPENITFTVTQLPNSGVLRCLGNVLTVGKTFNLRDIERGLLVYMHNRIEESPLDHFKVDVSDGFHNVPITVKVNISAVNPVNPVATQRPGALDITMEVAEKGTAKIISDTGDDNRSNPDGVTLTVEPAPRFGMIQVNGIPSNIFALRSFIDGAVTYVHAGGEVGPDVRNDSFTLSVSGKWIVNGRMIQKVRVHVSLLPVDNSPPVIHVGEQFAVEEGGRNIIRMANIQAKDLDTIVDEILCTILVQPSFGFIENVSPAPGYEKSRAGIAVTAFSIKHVQLGHIYYIQSVHRAMEPVEDRFTFQCTDGINLSDQHIFPIVIIPANDEEPVMFSREFVVMEGMSLAIDTPILNARDIDIPKNILEFEIIVGPKHGKIVQHLPTGTEVVVKFTLQQIQTASTIMYEHDGSETINDSFTVRLTDGKHVVEKQVVVVILPVDDETPRLSVNNGLEVEIGEAKIITNRFLKATDLDSLDSNLTFIIRQAPTQGFLQQLRKSQNIVSNLTIGMNFTQDDVDKALIQYVHTGQGGIRDLIKFDVTDGINPLVDRYFYITVGAMDKVYPVVINKGVALPEGGSVILTTDILSTSDLNSPDERLRFTITRPPSRGRLECTDHPGVLISYFTQLQLAGSKIRYIHTSLEEARLDSFEFQVTDGWNLVFRTFRVSITNVDNKLVLSIHALVLGQGKERYITPFELGVEDPDTSNHLLNFVVTQGPVHGRILHNSTRSVTTFTKEDLCKNLITYKHDGTQHGEDNIWFTITDGTNTGFYVYPETEHETIQPQVLKIQILLKDQGAPRLVFNRPALSLTVLNTGQLGFRFNSKVLKAVERRKGKDVQSVDLTYSLTEPPKYGFIRHNELNDTSMFTQGDINDMKIYYILLDGVNATTDVFSFTVEDKEGQRLRPQPFLLHWCWVSIEKEVYRVEEEIQLLEVTLRRRGYLGETSFVTISTVDSTAVLGQDFHGNAQRQVQFNPGQTRVTWRLRILDDRSYESSESFQILLSDPVLALLEEPSAATVEIIDPQDECTVFFSQSELKVEEDVGELLIPVQRRGDISQELMVTCYTQQGSARGTSAGSVLSFSDYISRPEGRSSVLLFHRGEREKLCRVLIIDDSLYEGQESFNVTLDQAMGGRVGAEHRSIHVTILPDADDEPSVFFSEGVYEVEESAGSVDVQIHRSGSDLSQPATVTLTSASTQPASAQAGVDYVAVGRSVDFAPGVTTVTVKVLILDDAGGPVLEGAEQFQLVLNMPMNATLGQPVRAIVTIDDSQSDGPSLQFALSEYRVDESDGRAVAVVIRSGDLTQRSQVRCYTRQSSAQAMMDYEERPDTDLSIITFQPGEREQRCEVTLVDDSEFEEEEEFRLVLGIPESRSAVGISLGRQKETLVKISDLRDKPVIQFSQTRFTVKEPESPGETATVRVSVQRLGDSSRTSTVRVHTRDGSATAGEDYAPVSVELQFSEGQTLHTVEVSVLYDTERETRETFTMHLRPDDNMVADIKNTKVMVYIEEGGPVGGLTFPAPPEIMSLLEYENDPDPLTVHIHRDHQPHPPAGYPLVCLTACDRRHSQFSALEAVCVSEGLNSSVSEIRWFVGGAETGVGRSLKELEEGVFMAPVRGRLLDAVYFGAGWRVQCSVRAVSLSGQSGLEQYSTVIHISTEEGMCQSHTPGVVGAEPFSAKIRYTGSEDPAHPHLISLTVRMPHTDGLLPLISTRPLSWSVALSADPSRVGIHRCSNLLQPLEVTTRYGFISNNSQSHSHTPSSGLRSPSTRRFYSNLDLEACVWTFQAYYDMSELLGDCGGSVTTDRQSLVQSFVSLRLPLFVSYLFSGPAGWMTFDLHTEMKLTFVYDTSILWQQGITSPPDTELQGSMYPTSMRINEEGRLVVTFRTEAGFRGLFIPSHPGSSVQSVVKCVDQPVMSFSLSLLSTESTFNQPTQTWSFTSQHSVRDYSGSYSVSLVPCVAPPTAAYTSPPVCHPHRPITFSLDVRFQQVSDAVPAEFTLNTRLYLMAKKELWLSDGSMGFGEEADVVFSEGSQIFGRVMVDPVLNLGSSFLCRVQKVFLCAGADGYVPKYRPDNGELGCLADSAALTHRFKILDKSSPHTQDLVFGGLPFAAQLAENTPGAEPLAKQAGSDGFSLSSSPLFQVAAGRQWYVHVVYTVRSSQRTDRHSRSLTSEDQYHHSVTPSTSALQDTPLRTSSVRRRATNEANHEQIGQQSGRGTNLQPISLQKSPEALQVPSRDGSGLDWPGDGASRGDSVGNVSESTSFQAAMLVLTVSVCLIGVTAFVCISRRRRTETTKKHTRAVQTRRTDTGRWGRQRNAEDSGSSEV